MNFINSFYLRYRGLGFSVIPIRTLAYQSMHALDAERDAKAPLVKWAQFQKEFPTPKDIENWSRLWPSAGIAVVCGLLSDVMVFDDDLTSRVPLLGTRTPQQEKDYNVLVNTYGGHAELELKYRAGDELQEALMAIQTARARSSKGRHFYFRMPRNEDGVPMVVGKRVGLLPKWDLQAEGSYVILPPTIHPSGTSYVWENVPEEGIAFAPTWLIEAVNRLVAPVQSTPTATGNLWQINMPMDRDWGQTIVVQGERNVRLTSWVGKQISPGGLYYDELKWPDLEGAAMHYNLHYNFPPLDAGEVLTVVRSVCKTERRKNRKSDLDSFNQTYTAGSATEVFTAAQLGIMDLRAPDFAIRDFIVDGTTQLFGKPKSGKSWLALQVACAVALNRPLFAPSASMYAFANHPQGFDAHQGDVLYLALEDGKLRLQKRMKEVVGTLDQSRWPPGISFATHWRPCFDGGLADIIAWLDTHPAARLVVVDTIAAFIGGGSDTKGSAFRAEYRMFRPIWELAQLRKIPFLIVDHASKSKGKGGSQDPFDSGAGTLGSQAAVDSVMILEHADKGDYARISYKGRDIERGFFDLEHTKSSPLWKLRATPDDLEAKRAEKAVNTRTQPNTN